MQHHRKYHASWGGFAQYGIAVDLRAYQQICSSEVIKGLVIIE